MIKEWLFAKNLIDPHFTVTFGDCPIPPNNDNNPVDMHLNDVTPAWGSVTLSIKSRSYYFYLLILINGIVYMWKKVGNDGTDEIYDQFGVWEAKDRQLLLQTIPTDTSYYIFPDFMYLEYGGVAYNSNNMYAFLMHIMNDYDANHNAFAVKIFFNDPWTAESIVDKDITEIEFLYETKDSHSLFVNNDDKSNSSNK